MAQELSSAALELTWVCDQEHLRAKEFKPDMRRTQTADVLKEARAMVVCLQVGREPRLCHLTTTPTRRRWTASKSSGPIAGVSCITKASTQSGLARERDARSCGSVRW
jgi:hypothetical protein